MRISKTIISAQDVYTHIEDPDLVILDCRYDLANPGWGFEVYQQGHIPQAVFVDMNKDLAGPITSQTGRHPLPYPDEFIQTAGRWGITRKKQVIVYDHASGAYASRLWWLLHAYGHEYVAVLDGGIQSWTTSGFPLAAGVETPRPADFEGYPDPNQWVTTREMEALLHDPTFVLIDSRSLERFSGKEETIDSVAGHIPGAVNRYHRENLNGEGYFLPQDQLRQSFDAIIGEIPPDHVMVYCGSGVTACHHLLAMEIAGLYGAKLYAGSWSEWIRDPKRPIDTGK